MVDERALYEALADHRLHAAGIDVWWSYPASYAQARHATNPNRNPNPNQEAQRAR